jgi:hypothetical protein
MWWSSAEIMQELILYQLLTVNPFRPDFAVNDPSQSIIMRNAYDVAVKTLTIAIRLPFTNYSFTIC